MRSTKTATKLADGRELIYYDERPGMDRSAADTRDLPATRTRSEIRYDALLDQWVIIASHRQGRTHLPSSDRCPLCPSRPGRATEIPADDYDVAVFENRFPSLVPGVLERRSGIDAAFAYAAASADPPHARRAYPTGVLGGDAGDALFVRRPGVGRCEVVCFTADHTASFAQLSPERVEVVLGAWTDRTRELGAQPGVEHVFVFENRGEEIGITLTHPHGQIYAYPFVPPRMLRMLRSARLHREQAGECLFCALLAAERDAGVRVVAETGRWTAFVPHAARWPFEVHVYPRRHLPDLPALDGEECHELARLYLDVLRRFDGIFGTRMPYIAAWHQAPVRVDRDLAHLYLQVFSVRRAPAKLKYLAGSESAAGVWVNDIAPERAAELLRDAR